MNKVADKVITIAFFGKSIKNAEKILRRVNMTCNEIRFNGREPGRATYKIATIYDLDISKVTDEQIENEKNNWVHTPNDLDIITGIISKEIHKARRN